MKLADVSIKRPVFTTMIVVAILVLGLFSFMRLNVDQFPNVDIPYITITSVLPGVQAKTAPPGPCSSTTAKPDIGCGMLDAP